MWPAGSQLYWITSTSFVFLQSMILRHPSVMKYINPNFYNDMMKVFYKERTTEDSLRYINKIKNLEDTSLMTPTTEKKVLEQLFYELSKMKQLYYILKLKRSFEDIKNIIDITPFLNKNNSKKDDFLNKTQSKVKTIDFLLKNKLKEKLKTNNTNLDKSNSKQEIIEKNDKKLKKG